MDPQIEFYKAAFLQKKGNGFDIPVFDGTSRYQYARD